MSLEGQLLDRKSLRTVTGKAADFGELAKDCVAFAAAQGGRLLIGIEDDRQLPPEQQRIPPELLDLIRKRIAENTVGVQVAPRIVTAENGGEYLELIIPRSVGIPSTSDGRYYLRVADSSRPVVGNEVMRMANDRGAFRLLNGVFNVHRSRPQWRVCGLCFMDSRQKHAGMTGEGMRE